MFSPHIFRANDIRGRFPRDFDLRFTKTLAKALCLLAKKNNISKPKFLIGHDARLSSPGLSRALEKHLKALGADCAAIGLAPSPLCCFLLYHYSFSACIIITASHNPPEHNGFKIFFHKKYKIAQSIEKLKKISLAKKPSNKIFKGRGRKLLVEAEKPYIESLKKEFSLKPASFAIDAGSGALGPLAKKAYRALGLKPLCLLCRPDGRFPVHHPDPSVEENLALLKKSLRKKKLALGFGFDGDGDRLAAAQEGQTLFPDEFGWLFIKDLIKKNPQALILADVKCSDWLFKKAKKKKANIVMTASGHGLIREEMEKRSALLALEFSGHIFFNDREKRGFDDALYASLRLLEILDRSKKPLSALLPKIPGEKTGEIRLDMQPRAAAKKLSLVRSYLKKRKEAFISIDGIRLSRKNGWALFRKSNTQEALTMRFAANSKSALKKMKKEFADLMGLESL